jgi:hypothetical protein
MLTVPKEPLIPRGDKTEIAGMTICELKGESLIGKRGRAVSQPLIVRGKIVPPALPSLVSRGRTLKVFIANIMPSQAWRRWVPSSG